MPWKPFKRDDQWCVYKVDDEEKPVGESLGCHDTPEKAQEQVNALYANEKDMGEFLTLTILAEYGTGQPVEFLRTGVFTDAYGREVEINGDLLDSLITNFQSGAAGQDVPIDVLHERKEAAGWIAQIWRQGDSLWASVEWNDLGRKLVGDKIYRYLSATLDLGKKILRSISLVNFPAVKGMAPVSLQEAYFAPDALPGSDAVPPTQQPTEEPQVSADLQQSHTEVDMADEKVIQAESDAARVEKAVTETVEAAQEKVKANGANLGEQEVLQLRNAFEAEVRTAIKAEYERLEEAKGKMMAQLMTEMREERELVEFCDTMTSEGRYALPVKADELQATLSDMPPANRRATMKLLKTIHEQGTVDFTEHGTTGGTVRKRLDAEMTKALRSWLKNNPGDVDTFFKANDLGNPDAYDLEAYNG